MKPGSAAWRKIRILASVTAGLVGLALIVWHSTKSQVKKDERLEPRLPMEQHELPDIPADLSEADVLIEFFAERSDDRPAFVARYRGTKYHAVLSEALQSTLDDAFADGRHSASHSFVPPQLSQTNPDECAQILSQLLQGNDRERAWAVETMRGVRINALMRDTIFKHPELAAMSGDGYRILDSLCDRLRIEAPEKLSLLVAGTHDEILQIPALRADLTLQLLGVPKDITPQLAFYPTEQDRFWAFNTWLSSAQKQKKAASDLDISTALQAFESTEYQEKAANLLGIFGFASPQ